jgi:hypothetical protein
MAKSQKDSNIDGRRAYSSHKETTARLAGYGSLKKTMLMDVPGLVKRLINSDSLA